MSINHHINQPASYHIPSNAPTCFPTISEINIFPKIDPPVFSITLLTKSLPNPAPFFKAIHSLFKQTKNFSKKMYTDAKEAGYVSYGIIGKNVYNLYKTSKEIYQIHGNQLVVQAHPLNTIQTQLLSDFDKRKKRLYCDTLIHVINIIQEGGTFFLIADPALKETTKKIGEIAARGCLIFKQTKLEDPMPITTKDLLHKCTIVTLLSLDILGKVFITTACFQLIDETDTSVQKVIQLGSIASYALMLYGILPNLGLIQRRE